MTQKNTIVPAHSVFPTVNYSKTYVFCIADPGLRLTAVNPFPPLLGSLCPGWELVFGEGDLPASTDNMLAELTKDCLQACIKHLDGTYQALILLQTSARGTHGQGFDMELAESSFWLIECFGEILNSVCMCAFVYCECLRVQFQRGICVSALFWKWTKQRLWKRVIAREKNMRDTLNWTL